MEYVEEYDEQCIAYTQKIENAFRQSKKLQNADKERILNGITSYIKDFKSVLKYYKSDLYLVPRAKEAEFRQKYDSYLEKLTKYELASKKMEMVLNKDSEGLRQLKHQYDPARANQNLNEETQKLI